jgi:hypothetical protein
LVWTTLLYKCETWRLKKEDIKRLEATVMWMWSKMENILWSDRIRNEEIPRRVGEVRKLVNLIQCRKRNWIGHIVRGQGILKEVLEGRMEGREERDQERGSWMS